MHSGHFCKGCSKYIYISLLCCLNCCWFVLRTCTRAVFPIGARYQNCYIWGHKTFEGNNCLLKQAFIKVPLHLTGDDIDRMKLLTLICFLSEEAQIFFLFFYFFTWVCFKANWTLWDFFSMEAVVIGFGLSSCNGNWLSNIDLFLGPMLLGWTASDILSALLPSWRWCLLHCWGSSPTCYPSYTWCCMFPIPLYPVAQWPEYTPCKNCAAGLFVLGFFLLFLPFFLSDASSQ